MTPGAVGKRFPPRLLTYTSVAVLLVCSVVVAAVAYRGWSWPLFAWGALLGPLWVLTTAATSGYGMRFVARRIGASASDVAAARARSRERFTAVYPAYAALGLPWGIVAASLRSPWPDMAIMVYAVLGVVVPLAVLPRLARRATARTGAQG